MANGQDTATEFEVFPEQDGEQGEEVFQEQEGFEVFGEAPEPRGSELFQAPEISNRPRKQRINPDDISPWDFDRFSIGTPWRRGAQNALRAVSGSLDMLSDWRGIIQENTPTLIPEVGNMDQAVLDRAAQSLRRYSQSIKSRPSSLSDPDHWTDYFEPNRIYETLGEGIPLTGSLIGLFAANPAAGTAAIIGIEGGEMHNMMEQYEENTGEEVSDVQKIMIPLIGGSFNSMLERFGIQRILKVAKGAGNSTLTRSLFNTTIAAINEGATEGTQEVVSAVSQFPYSGIIPNNLEEQFIKGAYAGVVVGGGLGGTAGLLSSISHRTPNDSAIETFERGDDGLLTPTFRIQKPGHEREGEVVSLDEALQMEDIQLPLWRRERLRREIVERLPDEEFGDLKVESSLVLMDAIAEEYGYESTDAFIDDAGIVVKDGKIEKGDLLQTEAFHGSPHDFDKFSTESIGTGEGFQAFGWGLYFTESPQIAAEYARKLSRGSILVDSIPMNSLDTIREKLVFPNINSENFSIPEINSLVGDVEVSLSEISEHMAGDINSFEAVRDDVVNGLRELDTPEASQVASIINKISPESVSMASPGSVYKVTLNKGRDTSEYRWFPWRDGVSQQDIGTILDSLESERLKARDQGNMDLNDQVSSAIELIEERVDRFEGIGSTAHGASIYGALAQAFGSTRLASKFLEQAGFDGTRYKANAGNSTSYNYVVFNENIVEIEGKDTIDDLFQTTGNGPKASVNFSEGETVLKFFQSADISSVLHEMAHIYRRFMPEQIRLKAEEAFNVEESNWTREKEEEFARKFEQWLGRGGPSEDSNAPLYQRFRNWLVEIYGRMINTLGGEEMTGEQRQFFNDLFQSLTNDIERMSDPVKQAAMGHWYDKFFNIFDIENRFNKVGLDETGFHLKNYFSIQSVYTNEGLKVLTDIPSSVRRDKGKASDAVLLSEDLTAMEEIVNKPEADRSDVESAALIMREYFDQSQAEYRARGMDVDFKNRLLGELNAKLSSQLNRDDEAAIRSTIESIQQVEDMEFTHIPFQFWIRNLIDKNPQDASSIMQAIERKRTIDLGFRERATLRISDLIEEIDQLKKEDIHPKDILASYSKQKGKDFALLNIRRAAIAEGGLIPKEFSSRPPGFKEASPEMRLFENFHVKDVLYHWISTQLTTNTNEQLRPFQRAINIVKMWAFWNPLFLPMYDVLQSHMAGAMNIMRPIKTGRQIKQAFRDVLEFSDAARLAETHGTSSQPFNSPLEQIGGEFDIASRTTTSPHNNVIRQSASWVKSRGEHAFADIIDKVSDDRLSFLKQLGGIRPALRNTYEASWNTAWFLDRVIRQVTYNKFIEDGLTPREAAQRAAQSHADYASVPPSTRRALNTIFFTPTFKIAMGKWMADSIRATGNLLAGTATRSQNQKAAVLMRTVAILGAFDMLMLTLGFDRDEWGRRYVRPTDSETGQRELVINWTGPHNLFLKYAQRTKAAFGPEVPNPMLRVLQQNSWEVTPILRVATSIATNSKPDGSKIWFVGDDSITKSARALEYASQSMIQLIGQLTGEEEFGKEGGEAFAREYGQLLEQVTSPFLFKYTRQVPPIRLQHKLQMMMSIHAEEVQGSRLMNEILSRGRNAKEVAEEYINGTGAFSSTAVERSENLTRRMQELIWDFEEENYDMWSPDALNMHREEGQVEEEGFEVFEQ